MYLFSLEGMPSKTYVCEIRTGFEGQGDILEKKVILMTPTKILFYSCTQNLRSLSYRQA